MQKTLPRKILEKDVEKLILQFLQYLPGCYAWKNHTTGYFNVKKSKFTKQKSDFAINGVSDILGVYNGKFLAIEVKAPTNKKRSIDQDIFIETVRKNGGVAFYATSIEDVKQGLGMVNIEEIQ